MSKAPILEARHITKSYATAAALHAVSLKVAAGEVVCLLGPSGCGKTTLLRIIAGLEHADGGEIMFEGKRIDGMPTHQRGFGLMFQDYALFPHKNVAQNIAFGLRMQGARPEAIRRRVDELLDLVGLAGYNMRRVDALSGGERQRVALARSLAPNPRLLMLDEPLGALDRALRERLQDELRVILSRVGVTSLYVTHDQAEAFAIADRVVLMRAGQIEQEGTPEQLYHEPATVFAARFLGLTNLLEARVTPTNTTTPALETALGTLHVQAQSLVPGSHVTAVLRPEAAQLSAQAEGPNIIRGTVLERSFRGSRTRVTLQTNTTAPLEFELDDMPAELGTEIALHIRPEGVSVIV